jgi:hypothetical protein
MAISAGTDNKFLPMSNATRQAKFKVRDRQGLGVLQIEVNLEILAATLRKLGYPVLENREPLAKGVERLLIDLAARTLSRQRATRSDAAAHQIRIHHQPTHRQGARS